MSDKDFECIIIDSENQEYEITISSDAFLSEETIKLCIAKEINKKAEEINIKQIDAMFKIVIDTKIDIKTL